MASVLLKELQPMATEVKISQIEDAVGASWAGLAMEGHFQGEVIGTQQAEAGVEGMKRGGGNGT